MDFLTPTSWADALAVKAQRPESLPVTGGTDVMVELNFNRRRPPALLDLSHVSELREWSSDGDWLRIGSAVTYTTIMAELGELLPGLAGASRTVGSPLIRNRGTVGGNLGSASPAGDAHPPLLAGGALVELASVAGTRTVPIDEFFVGPKRSVLDPTELIAAVLVPRADGPQQFAKVGPRNAMVIAVSSFSLALHSTTRTVGTGMGSVGPTPLRALEAETFAAGALPWQDGSALDPDVARHFGDLVAGAAAPIDDVRGTAAYRRHTLAVLARRCLTWAWGELCD
jgi:CO/xanthine dehydrogenase FAD-binding subunit